MYEIERMNKIELAATYLEAGERLPLDIVVDLMEMGIDVEAFEQSITSEF